ncbi:DUF2845 domain-containing protein [Marinobacter halodurans]|uniref:DUF2845 domain-containing protein n=1 Tax=Marinobacter halodurans TaxID=2528979 RepID=A0ABY1ZJW8_9GAMM|nr:MULTISPECIES: DUF2845 domain-containing protein [Marinobacter]ROT98723.1 DUF2845 domain-containing protein [Marinobacter sp. R17]TBW50537.1 DUF2845 domain-containing protein [Marinobacter halodurans]
MRLTITFTLALLAIWPALSQAAFRCGTGLVDVGDWPVEVEERCGQPDYVAVYPEASLPGIGIVQTVEHWYYNPGPSGFVRRLVFRNGKLTKEESMGYGFLPGAAGDCKPNDLREGMNEFEIVRRCGDPLSKHVEWIVPYQDNRNYGGLTAAYPQEEWLYEFGRNEFRRVVTFRNGRITRVESTGKPAR